MLGDYAVNAGLNEAEQLSVELVHRLSRSPEKLDALRNSIGADKILFNRAVFVGQEGLIFESSELAVATSS